MSERDIQAAVQIAASNMGHRLLRNNVGALFDKNGRLVRFGLGEGTSDLIGWTSDGRFLAVEVKAPGHKTNADRLASQLKFIAAVNAAGGVAGMVTNVDEFRSLFNTSK